MEFVFLSSIIIVQNNGKWIIEINQGLNDFINFGTIIDKIKNLRSNLKHGINFGPFNFIFPKNFVV